MKKLNIKIAKKQQIFMTFIIFKNTKYIQKSRQLKVVKSINKH